MDLHTLIEQRGRLTEADARQIYARLVLAVKAAHDVGIALRSIKPETIQVWQPPAGGWEVALCDLFCAATVDETEEDGNSLRGLCGTPEFCAPEVVLFFWADRMAQPPPAYGPMADIWALGICLHVMLCGCFPFQTSVEEEELLRTINTAQFQFNDPGWRRVSHDALDLVSQLLERDPNDRPYLEEVCSAFLGAPCVI